MARKRRKFETELKKRLVAGIESGQITANQVARNHDINPTVISTNQSILKKWLSIYLNHIKKISADPSCRGRKFTAELKVRDTGDMKRDKPLVRLSD